MVKTFCSGQSRVPRPPHASRARGAAPRTGTVTASWTAATSPVDTATVTWATSATRTVVASSRTVAWTLQPMVVALRTLPAVWGRGIVTGTRTAAKGWRVEKTTACRPGSFCTLQTAAMQWNQKLKWSTNIGIDLQSTTAPCNPIDPFTIMEL